MKSSIRWRVLLASMLVTSSVLVIAGAMIYALLKYGLVRQLDERLLTAAHSLTPAFENDGGEIHFEWEGVAPGPGVIFRAWDAGSGLVAESMGKVQLSSIATPLIKMQPHDSIQLSDGSAARVAILNFEPRVEPNQSNESDLVLPLDNQVPSATVTLEVAASLGDIETILMLARQRMLIVLGSALLVSMLILWPVTGMVIRPINMIAAKIDGLDAAVLSNRIDAADCPLELRPIALRLNEFIARLEQAFQRERITTANIAHELRTPLAGLKTTFELAESRPRSAEYYQKTLVDCHRISDELERLVERILLLARLDAGKLVTNVEKVDLASLLHDVWDEVLDSNHERTQTVRWDLAEPLWLDTDCSYLRLVFRNLIANALEHSLKMVPIEIGAKRMNNGIEIDITNACQPMGEADLTRLKERFFQGDGSRTRTGRNSGLGLSICDELVRLLNGKLDLSLVNSEQFRVAISFSTA